MEGHLGIKIEKFGDEDFTSGDSTDVQYEHYSELRPKTQLWAAVGGVFGSMGEVTHDDTDPDDDYDNDYDDHDMTIPYDGSEDEDDDSDFADIEDPRFLASGWGDDCLQDTEDIDFEFVYALHTFVATVEGQANATKGDTMAVSYTHLTLPTKA